MDRGRHAEFAWFVACEEHRTPSGVELLQDRQDGAGRLPVQIGRGFVGQDHLGISGQGVQTSEARTIAKASPPIQPTWPKPALLLPVGAVLGLLAGCGLALAFGPVRLVGPLSGRV